MPLPRLHPDERPWLITRIAMRVTCALNRFFTMVGKTIEIALLGAVVLWFWVDEDADRTMAAVASEVWRLAVTGACTHKELPQGLVRTLCQAALPSP
jgi:hypothetical protein